MSGLVTLLEHTFPDRLPAAGRPAAVFPVTELQFRGTPAQFAFLVTVTWVTASLVLLIAGVNVTGLLIARPIAAVSWQSASRSAPDARGSCAPFSRRAFCWSASVP